MPLLNTLISSSSGVSTTWAHSRLSRNNRFLSIVTLVSTAVSGVYFLVTQHTEYSDTSYRFTSRGYGRISFLATGLHGPHVALGCLIITVRRSRISLSKPDEVSHHNFEFPA